MKLIRDNPSVETKGKIYQTIGMNIWKQRNKRQWTQERAANASGMHRTSFTNIENGKQRASIENLIALSNGFGCKLSDLLKGIS